MSPDLHAFTHRHLISQLSHTQRTLHPRNAWTPRGPDSAREACIELRGKAVAWKAD